MPNKKAAPQFAFANEEPLIEVRCKIHPQSAFFYLVGNKSFIPPNEPRTEEAS